MRAVWRITGVGVMLAVLSSLGQARAARPSRETVIDVMQRVVRFKQVALSPDGSRVAWVETVADPQGLSPDKPRIQMMERAAPEAAPRRITAASDGVLPDERELAWSPDGRQLAFLSDAEKKGQAQLYVVDVTSGQARKLTSLSGMVSQPQWSPDGRSIALLVMEGTLDAKGPVGPAPRETGVVQESHVSKRLAVVNVAEGKLRVVSPADLFIYEYAWSPEGKRFAVTAAPPPGDANWWVAQLYLVAADTGVARVLHKPTFQVAEPTWSPDGKEVAFLEGLMSDEGINGGDVFIVPARGGKARSVTQGLEASAAHLHWQEPGRLVFSAVVGGEAAVSAVDPRGGTVSVLWRGVDRISDGSKNVGLSLSRDGAMSAVVRESFFQPPEVHVGPIGEWKALSRRNVEVKSPAGSARSLTWKSDGWEIQGWLLAPPLVPAGTRAPMVTVVHGGPAGVFTQGFHVQPLLLASQGYYVFMPNPRGSFGRGAAFVEANRKDFGHGDLRDILAGVDAVLASELVDGERLGIMGWSYGGFMTMWAVTQTRRFGAAVAGAGISNWQSYYGTNLIDMWMVPYFGASVYDAPELYARSSPMNFIQQVRTPTLVVHGERDAEIPASQGREFFKGLKAQGVKTQFVVYEDEGHGLRMPAHQRDRLRRTAEWFDTHLAPVAAPKVTAPTR
ncbi:S9 family peptidase [Hyalangium rubrum]|uniref:S9 family peptidase n=1 Tax=Hyalangium rubrum TaxID=3103134 RepID=A0ABU5H0D0_9BACT|nr:S9 family peptidase [Hyalangium sp. s54d21]MDY7226228.1 S9 family peptidase [Hyalangium sp. s54d21]